MTRFTDNFVLMIEEFRNLTSEISSDESTIYTEIASKLGFTGPKEICTYSSDNISRITLGLKDEIDHLLRALIRQGHGLLGLDDLQHLGWISELHTNDGAQG